jgi:hypothetical protein
MYAPDKEPVKTSPTSKAWAFRCATTKLEVLLNKKTTINTVHNHLEIP